MKRITYFIGSLLMILLIALKGSALESLENNGHNNFLFSNPFNYLFLTQTNQNKATLLWFEDWELSQQDYSRWRLFFATTYF